jgi:DNA/RNA-binding domain of Phe-tRNA-synthetase-like protein
MPNQIRFTDAWHAAFGGGHVGLLLVGPVDNHRRRTALDEQKRALQRDLRRKYSAMTRAELRELPVLQAYTAYYRQFRKTYHIQLQLESVAHKGKSMPAVNPLVDACFAAEMETHMLTASHDADKLAPPVTVDASTGDETLHMLNGTRQQIKGGDMMMADAEGVVCTILYGQDRRTPVSVETERVLYVTYAPADITRDEVARHHDALLHNVRLFAPEAAVELQQVVAAGAARDR